MTKAEFIHALHDFPLSTEIVLAIGDPLITLSIDSWFSVDAESGCRRYALLANFLPQTANETTFICRTCRGSITEGQKNQCPACEGKGHVKLANYHRW